MFYNDLGDFLNNPPSFGSNPVFPENILFSVSDFPGASGLQKGQGQRARFRIFETKTMGQSRGQKGQPGGKGDPPRGQIPWPRERPSFCPRGSDAVDLSSPECLVT